MAARLNKLHQEDIRQKIQASQLINVLQAHALTGDGEFSMTRMKAIEILLRKSVADLSAISLSGPDGGPIEHSHGLSTATLQLLDEVSARAGNPGPSASVQD